MPQTIAARIVEKGGDYALALKGNQSSLHKDVRLFFVDPVLAGTCATQPADIDAGYSRIEERLYRVADAGGLAEPKRIRAWVPMTPLPRVRIDWTANVAVSAVIPTHTQASSAVTS